MFDNLIGQSAAKSIVQDIEAGLLAPAMLFSGPEASGKGTAALELGRVISCEAGAAQALSGAGYGPASWNCSCPACARHRLLIHGDLLCLGYRPFSAEIAAASGALKRELSAPCRLLFIRAVRKLLARFNPVLYEDDPKAAKIAPLVNSLEEDIDSLENLAAAGLNTGKDDSIDKLVEGIKKDAFKLEADGLSETVPIAHIRKAAYWARLAPSGRGKLLVIENADRMLAEAKNSLLKILEEPPPHVTFVLTSTRPAGLLPTIISRLRPYRFYSRDAAAESEVIRRVFRDNSRGGGKGIGEYLDSFLPVSGATLDALAAFFAASVAYKAAVLSKKRGEPIPEEVVLLGKAASPKAEAAGLGRPAGTGGDVINLVMEKAEKFEMRPLFSRFIAAILDNASLRGSAASSLPAFSPKPAYNEIWQKNSTWLETAVAVYKLRPAHALEKYFTDLSRSLARL